MKGRRRVLGPLNGSIPAEVMFVGEAPGRLGAEVTGVPFKGDHAGRNFERLLKGVGLDRDAVFITNAVICNPRSPAGANSRPAASEIRNCSTWLERTILLVDPKLVVSLGVISLAALAGLEAHRLTLARDVGRISSVVRPPAAAALSSRRPRDGQAAVFATAARLERYLRRVARLARRR